MNKLNKWFNYELRILDYFCLNSMRSVNKETLMVIFPVTDEELTSVLDKLLNLKIIEEIKSEDDILYRNANPEYFPHGAENEK